MKRFSLREFLFLCAPIVLVGAGFVGVQLLHPPRDPESVIALELTSSPNPYSGYTRSQPTFDFEWKADARGGPKDDIQLLYTQKIIAFGNGDGRSKIIFQEPNSSATLNANNLSFSGGAGFGPAQCSQNQGINIPYDALPIWTKRVEWHGDFVAIPLKSGVKNASGVGIAATFSTLARIKGAARATKNFPVRFDARKLNPIQELKLETVSPTNAAKGADTCVTTFFRDEQRQIYTRLVAVEKGGKIRQLWNNVDDVQNKLWIGDQTTGYSSIWHNSQLFRLRDVPAQWGEIIYLVDATYNPNAKNANTMGDTKDMGAAEIERLKKAGWLAFSRRLTVRKIDEKIVAPNYPQTPNTKYLGTQTSLFKTDWIITARLKYSGPKLKPEEELDSPQGPEFLEADGKDSKLSYSTYIVKKSNKPGEYVAKITIPIKNLGQPRPVIVKMEIADNYAAPLHFETKLMVPKTPN